MEIRVVGLNSPPRPALEYVSRNLVKAFNARVTIEPRVEEIPQDYVNTARKQYHAAKVLGWAALNFRGNDAEVVLAIANGDGYVEGLNFVFGVAFPSLRAAIVFLERLKFMVDEQLFLQRLFKEVMHELGHVFGLSHCSNPRCVMRFSNTIFEVDEKSWRFCTRCFSTLVSRGINVGREALLEP